jgi:hypothetical protein
VIAEAEQQSAESERRDGASRRGRRARADRFVLPASWSALTRLRARCFTEPRFHASEGGAAAAADALPTRTSLAALLTGHILRDGEVVLLALKPSMWFIVFHSMRFAAVVLIITIGAKLWMPSRVYLSFGYAGAFLLAGRVMWAVLQWMGRLYVLTDLRIVRLSGVFNVEIFDCALRKVGTTRLTRTFREKLWRLGSIEIVPADDSCPPSVWQTVRRPVEVHAKVQATIERAKQGGACSHG